MVKRREIPRTAAFAWSPGVASPFLATGTKAGAVDVTFSNDTQLELWDLGLTNVEQSVELAPAASISTDSRFHDIAWVQQKDGHGRGIIAGALESGSLDLWDAAKLLSGDGDAVISRTSKHSGAIKALQFNPFRPELLATAGAKGEVYISDLNNISSPFRLGNTAARADDFDCLDWNKKVPHIMVTGSSGGFVTVWDMKTKKESLNLNNHGRKPVSAVAWDPEKPTRLITAVPLDTDPVILVWDLRNSNAPERILDGHQGGVLSLSWCRQDSDLLLSCGKDNRTICWNPQTGVAYGELPVVTNWTFQTGWNPQNPDLLATASFDGKIAVQTIQTSNAEPVQNNGAQALDGEEFFSKAQSAPQSSSFTLPKAPKWLERPCAASFGFGGKVVSVARSTAEGGTTRKSVIRISSFAVDTKVGDMTEAFEQALNKNDLGGICESHIVESSKEDEKADWKVIKTLIGANPRKELVSYLGFSGSVDKAATEVSKLDVNGDNSARSQGNGDEFFDNNADGDNFLTELASTKGARTNNPFHVYSESDSEPDKRIIRALVLGQFDKAMEVCLAEDRLSDAFMIATCGGQGSIDKVQKAYFKKQASGPKYLRLLASVVGKNLWDIVYNADLDNWKEVMATLCTYADANEFPDLCEALGDRLEEQMSHGTSDTGARKSAAFCYIAGSKLEKVISLWLADFADHEKENLQNSVADSAFSIHARSLQGFIEKVTVFREVTHYQDKELAATSSWKLASLYEKYSEYADIAAAHGQLQIAERYLALLPEQYPAAKVARNRVELATKKTPLQTTSQAGSRQSLNMPRQNVPPTFEDQAASNFGTIPPVPNAYAPSNPPQPQGPYAPLQRDMSVPSPYIPQAPMAYTPQGYQGQQTLMPGRPQFTVAPPSSSFGAKPQALGAPPRGLSPGVPPASRSQNLPNWNDMPEDFFKAPTSRRGTPATPAPAISTPFPNQFQTLSGPPMGSQSLNAPPKVSQPLPPPPKAGAPPPRAMTPQMNQPSPTQGERPQSSAASTYAPQAAASILQPQTQIPRGPSPYNVPPVGAPQRTSDRYAPVSAPQQSPMPQQRVPPPPNPYASRQNYAGPVGTLSSQGGPPQRMTGVTAPPPGPLQGPPPVAHQADAPPQQERQAQPPAPKYPPGDRSHIPSNAQPIYELLSADMQRVKSKAPANFKPQVLDTEKRLNILFNHLNNGELLKPNTIQDLVTLAQAMQSKNYEQAASIQMDIHTNRLDECGNWMVGVKRLIGMSRATP